MKSEIKLRDYYVFRNGPILHCYARFYSRPHKTRVRLHIKDFEYEPTQNNLCQCFLLNRKGNNFTQISMSSDIECLWLEANKKWLEQLAKMFNEVFYFGQVKA